MGRCLLCGRFLDEFGASQFVDAITGRFIGMVCDWHDEEDSWMVRFVTREARRAQEADTPRGKRPPTHVASTPSGEVE